MWILPAGSGLSGKWLSTPYSSLAADRSTIARTGPPSRWSSDERTCRILIVSGMHYALVSSVSAAGSTGFLGILGPIHEAKSALAEPVFASVTRESAKAKSNAPANNAAP